MKHLFKHERVRQAIIVLAAIAVIKLLWVIVEVVWLPTSGVDHTEGSKIKNLYYRVDFVPTETMKQNAVKPNGSIQDIKLIGIYSAPDMAVITVSYKGKTSVLMIGDQINGYVFEGAGKDFATFSQNDLRYTVKLIEKKQGTGNSSIKIRTGITPVSTKEGSTISGGITDTGDRKIIDRTLVRHYVSDMDHIFKEIGIRDMKKNGKIEGFRVSFIKKGSHFDQLGLRIGDIIKSVNGEEMNSEKAAFDIYRDIENITNLTLVIQRGNQEMELEYEVN